MSNDGETDKVKKERSPSFPFIPLPKAVDRLRALYAHHKLQPARVISIAASWGYAVKSSGLLQTVAALKQYSLIEDAGSGEDRKIQISDLGRRILQDERPGARETALKEAAKSPRLIAEYLPLWLPERPSDSHCISELQLDRGFTDVAAKTFLHIFDETVAFANLKNDDSLSASQETGQQDYRSMQSANPQPSTAQVPGRAFEGFFASMKAQGPKSLAERLKLEVNPQSLAVSAVLNTPAEVDTLIKMLEANKALLPEAVSEKLESDQ